MILMIQQKNNSNIKKYRLISSFSKRKKYLRLQDNQFKERDKTLYLFQEKKFSVQTIKVLEIKLKE